MNRALSISIVIALATVSPAVAHDPPGTPNFSCQAIPEWLVHDYVAADGLLLQDVSDNNLQECGTTHGFFVAGNLECDELEYRLGLGPGHPAWELLCNTDRPADYDGDMEFAVGGALLAVENGDGWSRGSLVCIGTYGHHGSYVQIEDEVFRGVLFSVGADASARPPPAGEPDCGDGVIRACDPRPDPTGNPLLDSVVDILGSAGCNPGDHRVTCMDACYVPFGPGADGTYTVWVHPTFGGGYGGTPTGASRGHVRTN